MMTLLIAIISMMALAYAQNISFTIVSRSRNRDNIPYHIVASILSNGVWFLTFRHLITHDMSWVLFLPYTVATVAGSVTGQKISMKIEKMIGANA